jgi:hypothetical protein
MLVVSCTVCSCAAFMRNPQNVTCPLLAQRGAGMCRWHVGAHSNGISMLPLWPGLCCFYGLDYTVPLWLG